MKHLELRALRRRMPLGVQQASGVLIATTVANGLTYLFHLVTSRLLGPSDYGVLVSLMAVFFILAVPVNLIQTVVANYTAQFRGAESIAKITALIWDATKMVLIYGGAITLIFILASGIVANFLQVASLEPVWITGTIMLPALLLPVAQGILQGLQRFFAFSTLFIVVGGGKLAFGLLLVLLGLGPAGALGAFTLSYVAALVTALIFLGKLFLQKGEPHGISSASAYGYSIRAFLGFLCFTVLTNVDVTIVKHFFPPEDAGYYAAASILGKIVLLASIAVAYVMFPKSVHNHTQNGETAPLARKAVAATALVSGAAAFVLFILPSLAVNILFGSQYAAVIPLVGPFALAMSLYAVANVLLFYYLSIENTAFVVLLLLSAVLEVGLLWAFHGSLAQVVMVLAAVALVLLVVSEFVCRGLTATRRSVSTADVSVTTSTG